MYIRYEMYFKDEPQDVGFMSELENTGMDEEYEEELMAPFNIDLPIISGMRWMEWSQLLGTTHYAGCYFTEEGHKRFEDDIKRLINGIEDRDNGWTVQRVLLHQVDEKDVLHQDEYQAVIKTAYFVPEYDIA